MTGHVWVRVAAAGSMLLAAAGLNARQDPAPAKSTLSGVYTAAQANRGEQSYMSFCAGCHSAGTYASPAFTRQWAGRPVAELFDYLIRTMPKNEPGSLSPAENAQVVAYLLKINRIPPGPVELPADPAALERITIEFPSKQRPF